MNVRNQSNAIALHSSQDANACINSENWKLTLNGAQAMGPFPSRIYHIARYHSNSGPSTSLFTSNHRPAVAGAAVSHHIIEGAGSKQLINEGLDSFAIHACYVRAQADYGHYWLDSEVLV